MARPLRRQWRIRTVVRRRHRTWVISMVFATLGWGVWWVALFLAKFAPSWRPDFWVAFVLSSVFAAVGFFFALFTVRARLGWILLACVPLFANGSLLLLPPILEDLGIAGFGRR